MNQSMQPHRGTLILVLGILSLVLCQLLGIAPWVMGNADLKAMDAGQMDPEGRGLTQAGKILGIVSIAISVISILAMIFFFGVAGIAAVGSGQ